MGDILMLRLTLCGTGAFILPAVRIVSIEIPTIGISTINDPTNKPRELYYLAFYFTNDIRMKVF